MSEQKAHDGASPQDEGAETSLHLDRQRPARHPVAPHPLPQAAPRRCRPAATASPQRGAGAEPAEPGDRAPQHLPPPAVSPRHTDSPTLRGRQARPSRTPPAPAPTRRTAKRSHFTHRGVGKQRVAGGRPAARNAPRRR